jgi:hypothetical protein
VGELELGGAALATVPPVREKAATSVTVPRVAARIDLFLFIVDFRSLRSQKANRCSCNMRAEKRVKVGQGDTPTAGLL